LISTALLLDSNIRNSVCTPAKLPCRRVVEGKYHINIIFSKMYLLGPVYRKRIKYLIRIKF
jgi:hypothetical protein